MQSDWRFVDRARLWNAGSWPDTPLRAPVSRHSCTPDRDPATGSRPPHARVMPGPTSRPTRWAHLPGRSAQAAPHGIAAPAEPHTRAGCGRRLARGSCTEAGMPLGHTCARDAADCGHTQNKCQTQTSLDPNTRPAARTRTCAQLTCQRYSALPLATL